MLIPTSNWKVLCDNTKNGFLGKVHLIWQGGGWRYWFYSSSTSFHPLFSKYVFYNHVLIYSHKLKMYMYLKSLFTIMVIHCFQYLPNIVETTWGWSFQTTRWTQKRRNTCCRSQAQKCRADNLWGKQSMLAMRSIL